MEDAPLNPLALSGIEGEHIDRVGRRLGEERRIVSEERVPVTRRGKVVDRMDQLIRSFDGVEKMKSPASATLRDRRPVKLWDRNERDKQSSGRLTIERIHAGAPPLRWAAVAPGCAETEAWLVACCNTADAGIIDKDS